MSGDCECIRMRVQGKKSPSKSFLPAVADRDRWQRSVYQASLMCTAPGTGGWQSDTRRPNEAGGLWGWLGRIFLHLHVQTSGLLHCCYSCWYRGGDRGEGRATAAHSLGREMQLFCDFLLFFPVWIVKVEYAFDKWCIYPEKRRLLCRYLWGRMQL